MLRSCISGYHWKYFDPEMDELLSVVNEVIIVINRNEKNPVTQHLTKIEY